MNASAVNIETLLNFKRNVALPLEADRQKLKQSIDKLGSAGLRKLAPTLRHFFQGLPPMTFADLPTEIEFSFTHSDLPNLPSILLRFRASALEINCLVDERNRLLRDHAIANSKGMSELEASYFTMMLTSLVVGILEHIDDSLYFARFLADQCWNYGASRYGGGKFRRYEVAGKFIGFMPAKDVMPDFQNVFVEFPRLEKAKPWWAQLKFWGKSTNNAD